jgi:hypothetical protein
MDGKNESETKRPRVLKKNAKPKPFNPTTDLGESK